MTSRAPVVFKDWQCERLCVVYTEVIEVHSLKAVVTDYNISMTIIMQSASHDYADSGKYTGPVNKTDGLPHGQSSHKLADGSQYNGDIRKGLFEGRGILTCSDGKKFQGQFQNGKFHGLGVLSKPGSMTFCGEFRNGAINGKGLMTFSNGTHGMKRQEGIFENGILIKSVDCRSVIEQATRIAEEPS